MNTQMELSFLKESTLGLFNKKGVSFQLTTQPYSDEGKLVKILIVNDKSTTSGNYQRIEISYLTSSESAHVNFKNKSIYEKTETVKKEILKPYLKSLINSPEGKKNKKFPHNVGKVDFYGIFEAISEEIFLSEDLFEFNGWERELYLSEKLGLGYNGMIDTYHVHGGLGSVMSISELNDITTTVEFGTSPKNGKSYLGVVRNIINSPTYPPNLYEDGTIEMFTNSVIEQYRNARNKKN